MADEDVDEIRRRGERSSLSAKSKARPTSPPSKAKDHHYHRYNPKNPVSNTQTLHNSEEERVSEVDIFEEGRREEGRRGVM